MFVLSLITLTLGQNVAEIDYSVQVGAAPKPPAAIVATQTSLPSAQADTRTSNGAIRVPETRASHAMDATHHRATEGFTSISFASRIWSNDSRADGGWTRTAGLATRQPMASNLKIGAFTFANGGGASRSVDYRQALGSWPPRTAQTLALAARQPQLFRFASPSTTQSILATGGGAPGKLFSATIANSGGGSRAAGFVRAMNGPWPERAAMDSRYSRSFAIVAPGARSVRALDLYRLQNRH